MHAVTTAYAAGLCVSGAAHMKLANIDNQRVVRRIEQAKGCAMNLARLCCARHSRAKCIDSMVSLRRPQAAR